MRKDSSFFPWSGFPSRKQAQRTIAKSTSPKHTGWNSEVEDEWIAAQEEVLIFGLGTERRD